MNIAVFLDLGLAFAPYIELNRIGNFTWRRKQSQLPKRSGLVLEYWTMDEVQRNSDIESNAPSLEPFRVILNYIDS
jgi:hypothetical protein